MQSNKTDGPILSGSFSKDKSDAFIHALSSLTKVDIEKMTIEFTCGDVKKMYINAINSVNTVSTRVAFDSSMLDGFTLQKDFKFGISKLQDFVGLLSIFNAGFDIKMSEEIVSISSTDNYLDFYGADVHKIKRGEDGDIDSPILATLTCDKSFKEILTATGKLEHKHIIFRSNIIDNFISLSVADKDVRGNSFTKKIPTPVSSDFKVCINKDHFSSVLTVGTVFDIYREVIRLKKTDNLYSIEYFIITLI